MKRGCNFEDCSIYEQQLLRDPFMNSQITLQNGLWGSDDWFAMGNRRLRNTEDGYDGPGLIMDMRTDAWRGPAQQFDCSLMHGSEGKDFVSKIFIKFEGPHSDTVVIPKWQVKVLDSSLGSGTKWINFNGSPGSSNNFRAADEPCGNEWQEVTTFSTWNIESVLGRTLSGKIFTTD